MAASCAQSTGNAGSIAAQGWRPSCCCVRRLTKAVAAARLGCGTAASSAIGSQEFEGRGAEELNAELAQALQKVFSQPKVFDTKALCIYPGAQCWNLYLDALVLDFGGNLLDALVLASRAALFDLRYVPGSSA